MPQSKERQRSAVIVLAVLVLAGATAHASDATRLVALRKSRSIVSEAATVVQLQTQQRVTATFTRGMMENAEEELRQIAEESRRDEPDLAEIAGHAVAAIEKRDGAALKDLADRLYRLEKANEPAD